MYSETDYTNVTTAIVDLATGARVVTAVINGREIEYGKANLKDLKALRTEIRNEIDQAAGSVTGHFLINSDKGL